MIRKKCKRLKECQDKAEAEGKTLHCPRQCPHSTVHNRKVQKDQLPEWEEDGMPNCSKCSWRTSCANARPTCFVIK